MSSAQLNTVTSANGLLGETPKSMLNSQVKHVRLQLPESSEDTDYSMEKYRRDDDDGDGVYERTMSRWRLLIRRTLVERVRREAKVLASMQAKIRSPWLDSYFVYTSTLGTHTFFMVLLPAFCFFGYGDTARGLIIVIAFGIYFSSFMKDLFCSPRPFSPPVTRLAIGTHHLEYGFPSTHSTNSVSIALYFFAIFHRLASSSPLDGSNLPPISPELYYTLCSLLIIYTFSIVFGRLYTAMHSFTDCVVGVLLGAALWWAQTDWRGFPLVVDSSSLLYQPLLYLGLGLINRSQNAEKLILYLGQGLNLEYKVNQWIQQGGWKVPLILIPLTLLAVHKHPQPVDDCPCFEDAIAILSVLLGMFLSQWVTCFMNVGGTRWAKEVVMPGSGWVLETGQWIQVERSWNDILVWWSVAAFKMLFGILTIFAWRIFAKSTLHLVLPPTFRFLARFFRLPNRRFYTPATEYKTVPSEFHSDGSGGFYLHPIPSVIDLPSSIEVGEVGSIGNANGVRVNGYGNGELKLRNGAGGGNGNGNELIGKTALIGGGMNRSDDKERRGKEGDTESDLVKHYDADVLTKVIVYAGIAILALEVIPLLFDILGLGVKSWVDT